MNFGVKMKGLHIMNQNYNINGEWLNTKRAEYFFDWTINYLMENPDKKWKLSILDLLKEYKNDIWNQYRKI